MRIGIGCTTFNRPECLAEWKSQIAKHTNMDNVLIYIADDSKERKGVAFRKNECLRALKDCDYIFLFDDDCFPIKDGWVEWFINHAGENHVLFLNDSLHNYNHSLIGGSVRVYNDCGGVFMYIPKYVLKIVGAFNQKFTPYGFEHCEWSMRACGGNRSFNMLTGTERYLFAHDYSTPNHKSSITDEEKKIHVRNNWDRFFKAPLIQIHIPL